MTKTDFKNIYEAFMHCDTNKLKKEFDRRKRQAAVQGKYKHPVRSAQKS